MDRQTHRSSSTRWTGAVAIALAGLAVMAAPALADFPYARPGADESDYSDLYLTDQVPNDICGADNQFKYAASPDPDNGLNNRRPTELGGVRGNHIVDGENPTDGCRENPEVVPASASAEPTAWKLTAGRPDVTIAVVDSGIGWDSPTAMNDLRRKTRLNQGEVPRPQGPCAGSDYDCNGDHVFNVDDYADDPRVLDVLNSDPRRVGPPGVLTPQDLLIAFSDGTDADSNGYVDDMVGWDFLDDDNDPYDDVQFGHGTGEAQGSSGEADSGAGEAGACANCMVIHLRVGDSFVADVNRFAAAVTYAADNDVQVVQSALGTLNNTTIAREAVDYAYRHGTAMVVSAGDEAAQHNLQPTYPHTILVNSVTTSESPEPDQSYLAFNGCTNFNSKITLAIESTTCSSDAVAGGSGIAGLIYSAAYNAYDRGALERHPDSGACKTVEPVDIRPDDEDETACIITPNEVRQLMASGTVDRNTDGDTGDFEDRQTSDINFLSPRGTPEPSCSPVPAPQCTSPFGAGESIRAAVNANRPSLFGGPAVTESYPARAGHDQFYGYGRANARHSTEALVDDPASPSPSRMPPEAELFSPEWYEQLDPNQDFAIEGEVYARGEPYRCEVLVAPGQYPNQARADAAPPGDFHPVPGGWCDGTTVHSGADAAELRSGELARVSVAALKSYFPRETQASGFSGPEPEARPSTGNGRLAFAPHSFTYKVVVTTGDGVGSATGPRRSGEDQRMSYLHRDADMLDGFPRAVSTPGAGPEGYQTGDGESSPAFADLDGDNRNELVYGSSDGLVHAIRPDGSELPGWPVRGEVPGFVAEHAASEAYASGAVPDDVGGAILQSVAVGDGDGNGLLEVYAADLEGKLYGWDHEGKRIFTEESNPAYSGAPLEPFENVRRGKTNRTQHGFGAAPVLADLDADGDQEIVIPGTDRHLYAWDTADSSPGSPGGAEAQEGFPILVVDPLKVDRDGVDPTTHRIEFRSDAGAFMNGAIIDTPALADITGDERPEIVVGTNEGYDEDPNTSAFTNPSFSAAAGTGLIEPGNTRLFALDSRGDRDGDPRPGDALIPGWPVPLAFLNAETLPVVGEGVTGNPIVGPASCPSGGSGPKVGAISFAGPGYILNPDGSSCYGIDREGKYATLGTDEGASSDAVDRPAIPAFGHPAFGDLGGASPAFVVPALGLVRALDIGLPEYQPAGQDFISAYDTSTSKFRPDFPQTQNDLSFLTGPAIGDIDGLPGEETVSGSASMDLNAYNAAGVAVPGWPKLSTDWTVATPLIGSFGTLDTEASGTPSPLDGPRKVVVGMTRSGYVNAYTTKAPACSPSSSPRFHHDNANSGNYERDAVLPGAPFEASAAAGEVAFTAPGDDLLCGTAEEYELATSDAPIDERNFDKAAPLAGAPEPAEAGTDQSFAVPDEALRYVAIRAFDEQQNVGRVALVDLEASEAGEPDGGGGDGDGDSGQGGGGSGGAGGDQGGGEPGGQDTGDQPKPGPNGGSKPERLRCMGEPATIVDGEGDDTVRGTNHSDVIVAGAGVEKVKGHGGNDLICAGAGADIVLAGQGSDSVRGGGGRDRLRGNKGSDVLVGNGDRDRLHGNRGGDELRGNGGADRLVGARGRDALHGNQGADKLQGNSGHNVLRGGSGSDRCDGGSGADRLSGCER